jgi:hypothetical protein
MRLCIQQRFSSIALWKWGSESGKFSRSPESTLYWSKKRNAHCGNSLGKFTPCVVAELEAAVVAYKQEIFSWLSVYFSKNLSFISRYQAHSFNQRP